jgi:hypothetical protein
METATVGNSAVIRIRCADRPSCVLCQAGGPCPPARASVHGARQRQGQPCGGLRSGLTLAAPGIRADPGAKGRLARPRANMLLWALGPYLKSGPRRSTMVRPAMHSNEAVSEMQRDDQSGAVAERDGSCHAVAATAAPVTALPQPYAGLVRVAGTIALDTSTPVGSSRFPARAGR